MEHENPALLPDAAKEPQPNPRLQFAPSDIFELLDMIYLAENGRCMACGWPLQRPEERGVGSSGCNLGDCSFRPAPENPEHLLWRRRTDLLVRMRDYRKLVDLAHAAVTKSSNTAVGG